MVSKNEIITSIQISDHDYNRITDLNAYADKVLANGKSICSRTADGELMSYILYYDDQPNIYITMVLTLPKFRGRGLSKKLMHQMLELKRNMLLEVHKDHAIRNMYEKMGFVPVEENEGIILMKYTFNG